MCASSKPARPFSSSREVGEQLAARGHPLEVAHLLLRLLDVAEVRDEAAAASGVTTHAPFVPVKPVR